MKHLPTIVASLIVAVAGCKKPEPRIVTIDELARETVAATLDAWEDAELPEIDPWCHVELYRVRQFLTREQFRDGCLTTPEHAHACQIWGNAGTEIRPVRYPLGLISPEARNGSVPDLAVHEMLHAMVECARFPRGHACFHLGNDRGHECEGIWSSAGSVERVAQSELADVILQPQR